MNRVEKIFHAQRYTLQSRVSELKNLTAAREAVSKRLTPPKKTPLNSYLWPLRKLQSRIQPHPAAEPPLDLIKG
jgi:hypothetical protein